MGRGRVGQDLREPQPGDRRGPGGGGRRRRARISTAPSRPRAAPSRARGARCKPYERQALLLRLADLVEGHFDELSALDTLDMGAPISRTARQPPARPRHAALLCRHGDDDPRRDDRQLAARRDLLLHAQGAGRRRRRDHPVERPARRAIWKIGPALATGCTVVLKPAEEAPLTPLRLGELMPGSRRAAGCRQHRPGLRRDRRRRARRASRRRQGRLHRLAPDRAEDRPGLGRQPEARVARARRQVARHRLRRRRSRRGGARRRHGRVRQLRADLQRRHAAVRRAADLRRVRRPRRRLRQGAARSATASTPRPRSGRWSPSEQLDRVTGYLSIGKQEGARASQRRRAADRGRARQGLLRAADGVRRRDATTCGSPRRRSSGRSSRRSRSPTSTRSIKRGNATTFGLGSGVWTRDVGKAHRLAKAIRAGIGLGQLLPGDGPGRAVRRLQDERLRPRVAACSRSRST